MTVSSNISVVRYTGNGITDVFPYTFKVTDAAHLEVLVADVNDENIQTLVLDTDFIVDGVGEESGGNVTLDTPLTTGHKISISRVVPLTQPTDFENQGGFFADTHEDGFDREVMIAQQLQEQLDRCPKATKTSGLDGEDVMAAIETTVAGSQAAQLAAENARDAAIVAQGLSEAAQGLSEDARDASVVAQGLSEVAQGLSEDARDAAVITKNASEAARDASIAAQGLSEDARDAAVIAQGLSEDARDAAVVAQGLSEDAADASAASALAASGSATAASGSATSASGFATAASASASDAADSAADAAASAAALNNIDAPQITLQEQGSDPATPAAGKVVAWVGTDGKLYLKDDTGAKKSTGGLSAWATTTAYAIGDVVYHSDNKVYKALANHTSGTFATDLGAGNWQELSESVISNYLSNGTADVSETGWSKYKNTVASIYPESGTGGTADITFAKTTTVGEVLNGAGSFKLTRDAANRQGQGVSIPFSIPVGRQGTTNRISMVYKLISGVLAGSTYADADIRFYIYDVTNSALIMLNGDDFMPGVVAGGLGQFNATFQAAYNSTSYRLCMHIASTNAVAFALSFDDIEVSNAPKITGAAQTNWVKYTPTVEAMGTLASHDVYWRRNGSNLEIMGHMVLGNTSAAVGKLYFPLASMISTGVTSGQVAAYVTSNNGNNVDIQYTFNHVLGANYVVAAYRLGMNNVDPTSITTNLANANGTKLTWGIMSIPILGWSSNMLLSSDGGNRQIVEILTGAAPVSSGVYIFPTVKKTTTGSYNTTTGIYTVPEAGFYSVIGWLGSNSSESVHVYINGNFDSVIGNFSGSGVNNSGVSGIFYAKAGDQVVIWSTGSTTLTSASQLTISKLSSPQTIASTEFVGARYTQTGVTSVASSATTRINFDTKDFDTHGAVTTGASWKFTAPYSGYYSIEGFFSAGPSSVAIGTWISYLYKNGVQTLTMSHWYDNEGNSDSPDMPFQGTIFLKAGEYIDVRVFQNSGNAFDSSASYTNVTIKKVG